MLKQSYFLIMVRRASEMWTLGRRGGSDVTGGERQNIVTLSAGRGSAWPGRRRYARQGHVQIWLAGQARR